MSLFLAFALAVQAPGPGVPAPQSAPARPQAPDVENDVGPSGAPSAPNSSATPDTEQAPEQVTPPPIELPPFSGLVDGLTQLQLAVGEGRTDVAVGIADALLAPNGWSRARTALETGRPWAARACDFVEPGVRALGLAGPSSAARAEVHYAAGVAFDRGGAPDKARERFVTAAALAGPGELRLDSSYNVGAIALGVAERLREAQRQQPPPGALAAPAPGQAAGPGAVHGGGQTAADPSAMLDQLEAAYRAAKLELVERLKADWHDADVRANLELIQRRLHEIEQQREELEQQKQQQQQQQQQQKQDSESKDSDSQKSDEPSSEKQDPSSSNEERQDPQQDGESKPEEQPQQGEQPEKQDGEQPENQDGEQPKPDEAQSESKTDESQQPQPSQQEERVLTREELQRILGRLEEIEKEGQAIQARLRRARRASAEKDW